MGKTCHIQQFVDRDPGPGARDFTCGPLSYDGHKGTDFRLPTLADMEAGVAVLAAAPGQVQAVRDGMADRPFSAQAAEEVKNRECGNGLVIDHGNGWDTQYCHLQNGSITVSPGDSVARGAPLGLVGLSGKTQFPHLHLSVRHRGRVIDPFRPDDTKACGGAPPRGLWRAALPYRPGAILNAGFAANVPAYEAIRAGRTGTVRAQSGALVLFGFAFGGQAGDEMALVIRRPDGTVLTQQRFALTKAQAQYFRASGKRLTAPRWPKGRYLGEVGLWRGGRLVDLRQVPLQID